MCWFALKSRKTGPIGRSASIAHYTGPGVKISHHYYSLLCLALLVFRMPLIFSNHLGKESIVEQVILYYQLYCEGSFD